MNFPLPDPLAREHSNVLKTLLQKQIVDAGGWLSFADYMQAALYTPGMGYYSAGMAKFGESGDFVTAPEISSLFGQALAQQVAGVLAEIPHGSILELGAGSGKLAVDILHELEQLGRLPVYYDILEISAELRQRQQITIEHYVPHLSHRVRWLTALPDCFNGLILANEVLDATPVHLVTWQNGNIFEQGVAWHDQEFLWQSRPLAEGELSKIALQLPPTHDLAITDDGYLSEISLANRRLIRSLAERLQQGVMLLIDYGFGEREYYHPQRRQGTLMCHYRHHAHDDPFYLPGLQDITAHVDFTAIAETALEAGLQLKGYATQAHFLINCGVTDILARVPADQPGNYLPLANQVQRLVSSAEMGELFKVIAFSKAFDSPLQGFSRGDLQRLL
ncbi:MAG: SAM-dependent methyltransferase [Nitrosomonas sp.]|nr:SAM-dependent methyltransferase [Nitrosomonas sp.]